MRGLIRRRAAVIAGVVTVAAATLLPVVAAAPASASTPIIFGAAATQGPKANGFPAYEKLWGVGGNIRPVGDARLYYLWDSYKPDPTGKLSIFPGKAGQWAKDNNRPIFMSVKSKLRNGTKVTWASIAAASPTKNVSRYKDIVAWAKAVKGWGAPLYFTFNHEPEAGASAGMGTPTEYINAWRNIVKIFRQQGVTNATYVFVATGFGFTRSYNVAQKYYPGDDVIDAIGADAYNWADCRPEVKIAWQSLQQIINPTTVPGNWSKKTGVPASQYGLVRFGTAHGKKLMLAEFGSVEWQDAVTPTSPSKASWLRDAQALLKQPAYSQFSLINIWNSEGNGTHSTCNFKIDSSTSALQAMRDWGQDPAFS